MVMLHPFVGEQRKSVSITENGSFARDHTFAKCVNVSTVQYTRDTRFRYQMASCSLLNLPFDD